MSTDAGGGVFLTTDWGALADIRNGDTTLKRTALDILIRRYWRKSGCMLRPRPRRMLKFVTCLRCLENSLEGHTELTL
jgi:hypothetical protein